MSRRRPSPDEIELFDRVVSDVDPLRRRHRGKAPVEQAVPPSPPPLPDKVQTKPLLAPAVPLAPPPTPPLPAPVPAGPAHLSEHAHGTAPGIDRRTQLRLKRGQLAIEARLDLHGMSRERAHVGLNGFLARQAALGRRCVLVITGKGRPTPEWGSEEREIGVIRRALPEWLGDHPNKERVLAFAPAMPQDGGSGAWYVLLRRRREDGQSGGGGA